MIVVRKSEERGHVNFGWLDTKHSFSFGSYYDPRFMGVSDLRVINDDLIGEGAGFDTHPHNNMEILTVVLEGAIAHKDSMGQATTIHAKEIQLMAAGTGITHSEFNPDHHHKTKLLQIWIYPKEKGLTPSYQEKSIAEIFDAHGEHLIVSQNQEKGSLKINQDTKIYIVNLVKNSNYEINLNPSRNYYCHLIFGSLIANGHRVGAGDALTLRSETHLKLEYNGRAQFILFDLR